MDWGGRFSWQGVGVADLSENMDRGFVLPFIVYVLCMIRTFNI